MKTTVSSKGQIVLPAALRDQDHVRAGESFLVERIASGQYLLKRLGNATSHGIAAWLQSCPAQDWFLPLPSESTASIGGATKPGTSGR